MILGRLTWKNEVSGAWQAIEAKKGGTSISAAAYANTLYVFFSSIYSTE
jgi:hypothetical protein